MNTRFVTILAVVVLAVVGGAYWFLQSPPPAVFPEIAPPAPLKTATLATPAMASAPASGRIPKASLPTPETASPAPPPLAEWEIKIDQVLRNSTNETETAQALINLLPTLPPEGQTEAAQHITNLILTKDYHRVLPLLRNPTLPTSVQDVLVTDLMNREDPVKLPALLDVAKIPNHPYHEEALNDLQIFLDQDNGSNWAQWDTAMKAYLKKQAQEQALLENPAPPPAP